MSKKRSDPKNEMLKVRCTQRQLTAWTRAAARYGTSLSSWVRSWLDRGQMEGKA